MQQLRVQASVISLVISLLMAPALANSHDSSERYIVHWQAAQPSHETSIQRNFQPRVLNAAGSALPSSQISSEYLTAEQAQEMQERPEVALIEPDPKRELLSFGPQGDYLPYGLGMIQALGISDHLAANQRLCIIDSGIDGQHPDFNHDRISGRDDSRSGAWNQDDHGHGTHVAGTIAALANGQGLQGLLPNGQLELIIVRAFNASGWAYSSDLVAAARSCVDQGANIINMSLGGNLPSTLERLAFAELAEQGILLVAAAGNDGLSTPKYPASYDSVISVAAVDQQAQRASFSQFNAQVELSAPGVGIWSTALTGRGQQLGAGLVWQGQSITAWPMQGSKSLALTAPLANCGLGLELCAAEQRICLMHRGENSFADKARNCQASGGLGLIVINNSEQPILGHLGGYQAEIPVWAVSQSQGLDLAAATESALSIRTAEGGFDFLQDQGTSMAAPHVSGAAALIWSHFPECHGQDIRAALAASTTDLGNPGRNAEYGHGLVNAAAAMELLASQGCQRQYWVGDQLLPDNTLVAAPPSENLVLPKLDNDRSSEQIAHENRQRAAQPQTGSFSLLLLLVFAAVVSACGFKHPRQQTG